MKAPLGSAPVLNLSRKVNSEQRSYHSRDSETAAADPKSGGKSAVVKGAEIGT